MPNQPYDNLAHTGTIEPFPRTGTPDEQIDYLYRQLTKSARLAAEADRLRQIAEARRDIAVEMLEQAGLRWLYDSRVNVL